MSVGHIARLLETELIPTVIIGVRAFRPRLEVMTLPRLLLTPHLMGRTIGAPNDRGRQRETLLAALKLLEEADRPGTLLDLPGTYLS